MSATPDPAVRVLDPSFNQYRLVLASVERLHTGCRWSEGPVWFGDGRYLLWSDIPQQSGAALGRGDGQRLDLPQALEQRQRPHARPGVAG
jgi:sugar lactone lactonase YvrE